MYKRICNYQIETKKNLLSGLTQIKGLGATSVKNICTKLGLHIERRLETLTDLDIANITSEINSNYKIGADVDRSKSENIRHLMSIKSYKGLKHRKAIKA